MIYMPAPADIDGGVLAAELRAAGVEVEDFDVALVGDQLRVNTSADESTVREVVDAHVPPAPEPDPDDEFRRAVEGATSIADLKAALLGSNGPGAEPRRAPR